MTDDMCSSNGPMRFKSFTKDTMKAISQTLRSVVDSVKYFFLFLSCDFEFILLAQFSNDPLEKDFSKLRQNFGQTYTSSVSNQSF